MTAYLIPKRLEHLLQGTADGQIPVYNAEDGHWYAQSSSTVIASDKTYVHDQAAASSSWTVVHNLDKFPSITVVDTAGTVVIGSLVYVDTNTVVITFNSAFSGKVYCN